MPTKIFSANVTIGEGINKTVIRMIPVKKIPLHLNLSDEYFIQMMIKYSSEKKWLSLIPKKARLPKIEIEYLEFMSNTNKEPEFYG